MKAYKKRLGQRILAVMESQKRTQVWLATQLGLEPSTVSRWINGQAYPEDGNLQAIATVLGVSKAYLEGESDEEKPMSFDLKQITLLIEKPELAPIGALAQLMADFQKLSCERRATTLAIFYDEPRIAAPYVAPLGGAKLD